MTTTIPASAQIISSPIKLSSPNSEGVVGNLEKPRLSIMARWSQHSIAYMNFSFSELLHLAGKLFRETFHAVN
ncbi:MAG: hypothetical protein M3115_03985 [Thermoproteota archaeon]|nr:hypothetical protein [Thermoproteota archaeon]